MKHARHTLARKKFLDNPCLSLRDIWQDAADMGHASPSTSQHHYIHDVFQENRLYPISEDFLVALTGINKAAIRKMRTRLPMTSKCTVKLMNSQVFLRILTKSLNDNHLALSWGE